MNSTEFRARETVYEAYVVVQEKHVVSFNIIYIRAVT